MTTVIEPTLFDEPVAAPVDADTASLLALIDGDPFHAEDREKVCAAIVATAHEHAGLVDPNSLRVKLADSNVWPNCIGTTIASLRHAGALEHAGWVITEGSTSGNNGRPARSYRLVKRPT